MNAEIASLDAAKLLNSVEEGHPELPNKLNGLNSDGGDNGDPWPEPDRRVLNDRAVPAPPFEWDSVPPNWREWIAGTAQDTGAPPDYVFANLSAYASGVTGNARRVSPWPAWQEPTNLWTALVGNPSSTKSPSQVPFTRCVDKLERDQERGLLDRRIEELDQLDRRIRVADATVESLAPLLEENQRGLLLVRSELAGFIGSFDRYKGGAGGSDRAFFLETYDGGPYTVDRVKLSKPIRIPYMSLSIVGGLQPDKLSRLCTTDDDGFFSRLMYVWPDPIPPMRPVDLGHEDREALLLKAFRRLRDLPADKDSSRVLKPRLIGLDDAARGLFDEFRKTTAQRCEREEGLIAGWRGKNPGRLLRIALVLTMLEWAASDDCDEPAQITCEKLEQARKYVEYLTSMMFRGMSELAVTDAQQLAARVAHKVVGECLLKINERELYQAEGFSKLRNQNLRERVFGLLDEAGWIRRMETPPRPGRHKGDWIVNPRVHDGGLR